MLSWRESGYEIISSNDNSYKECLFCDRIIYLYKELNINVLKEYYSESNSYSKTKYIIKKAVLDIIIKELSTDMLYDSIINLDNKSELFDLYVEGYIIKSDEFSLSKFSDYCIKNLEI